MLCNYLQMFPEGSSLSSFRDCNDTGISDEGHDGDAVFILCESIGGDVRVFLPDSV